MASIARPANRRAGKAFSPAVLLDRLKALPRPRRYWLAYSGGRDSNLLLHALAAQKARLKAPLSAIHVDHGLHPASGDWAAYCREQCHALGVPLTVIAVHLRKQHRASLEAVARDARYSAIADEMGTDDMLLTAHHADDQIETF